MVVLVVVGTGVYFFQRKSSVITPGEAVAPTPTPKVELTLWTDPAGFSFQYPKGLSVNNHEEDNENYAHVELTSKDHPGKIIVWASDPPAKKVDPNALTLDTTLGGESAKKSMIGDTIVVTTNVDSLVFSVEATVTDKDYWSGVSDTVVGSFAFVVDAPAAAGSAASSGDSFDEEEVVQ